MPPLAARPPVCLESKARILRAESDDGHDSHKIRHKFFKWLRHIELATNASSSEKFGSIHFATLFEIMATWRFLYKSTYYQRITDLARQPRVILASKPLEFWRILCESCPSSVSATTSLVRCETFGESSVRWCPRSYRRTEISGRFSSSSTSRSR